MHDLERRITEGLDNVNRPVFERLLSNRNLEQVLSRLRRIAALLELDGDQIDTLTGIEATDLDRKVCSLVIAALDLEGSDPGPMLRFAAWVARADYHLPIEIFTVNYDLLVETTLESLGVPYFDGFVGSLRARFRTELVEATAGDADDWLPPFLVRLWKLHGSVNWAWENEPKAEVVRLGTPVPDGAPAAIYPSDAKYDESRRVPFVVLHDRLRRALHHPETLVLISGYSFGDVHLNEMIFDAASRRPRSEIIVFCFDAIPELLAEKAAATPNLQVVAPTEAILGGVRADWEPFDESQPNLWSDGHFALGEFGHLANFLARSSPPQPELEVRLRALLDATDDAASG